MFGSLLSVKRWLWFDVSDNIIDSDSRAWIVLIYRAVDACIVWHGTGFHVHKDPEFNDPLIYSIYDVMALKNALPRYAFLIIVYTLEI